MLDNFWLNVGGMKILIYSFHNKYLKFHNSNSKGIPKNPIQKL